MRLNRRQAVAALGRFGDEVTLLRKPLQKRLALDTVTPNRAADRWKESTSVTAATTRSRRSTDYGEGITGSFTAQRSSHRSIITPRARL